ncbi:MAG: hypothetical protein GY811_07855 [Myxococcales bacterium]|nr:hypothetical protein [Myxococcales bacterium]
MRCNGAEVADAICKSLSGGGMQLESSATLRSGAHLDCWLPTGTSAIVTFATIVRTGAGRAGTTTLGLRFEHPTSEIENRVFCHVLDLQRAQIRRDSAEVRKYEASQRLNETVVR